eukprot:4294051-Amphidinium_carterae.1
MAFLYRPNGIPLSSRGWVSDFSAARMHARTHARTRAHTHTHTHAQDGNECLHLHLSGDDSKQGSNNFSWCRVVICPDASSWRVTRSWWECDAHEHGRLDTEMRSMGIKTAR